MSTLHPHRLPPSFREKVWGTTDLTPWFPMQEKKIGEVWFEDPLDPLPILLKFIFASEKLSVQVHPDDIYARAKDNLPGKTEMWYILRAEPGARLAIGFREPITRERLRESALSGEIEGLLNWIEVAPGETLFVAPGTVHAIGGGIALCEIQQMSDTTYRLFDYGRGRPLHLDHSVDVSSLGPWRRQPAPSPLDDGWLRLVNCPYFATDSREVSKTLECSADPRHPQVLIVLDGHGEIDGQPYRAGEMWEVPAASLPFRIEPAVPTSLLRTGQPE